jgi:hypothetical protein
LEDCGCFFKPSYADVFWFGGSVAGGSQYCFHPFFVWDAWVRELGDSDAVLFVFVLVVPNFFPVYNSQVYGI